MKKIVTFVLLCTIMLTHSFSAAFADVPKNDGLFVVITNAAGDMVEKIPIENNKTLPFCRNGLNFST